MRFSYGGCKMFDFDTLAIAYKEASTLLTKGVTRISINPNLVLSDKPYCYGWLHIDTSEGLELMFDFNNAESLFAIISELLSNDLIKGVCDACNK